MACRSSGPNLPWAGMGWGPGRGELKGFEGKKNRAGIPQLAVPLRARKGEQMQRRVGYSP